MLTRRGRVVLCIALVLLIAGRILGVTELFALAAAAVAVVVIGLIRVRAPQLRVTLSARVTPPVISVGEPATFELTVENSGAVPTPGARLHLVPESGSAGAVIEVPRLVPGESASVALRLPSEKRGRHEVRGYEAVLGDVLGTAQRRVSGIGTVRYGVRPLAETLSGMLPSGDGGADLETTRSSAERLRSGASLLRPYVAGDDLRRVHWATTARVGDLMVREGGDRELDTSSGACVVLSSGVLLDDDAPRARRRFEDAVRVAASVLTAAEKEGSFRLVVPGGSDSGAGSGTRHLDAVFEALTDVWPTSVAREEQIRPALPPASVFEGRVCFFVAACESEADLVRLFGSPPELAANMSSAAVMICVGAPQSRIEQVGHRQLLVSVAVGESLEELWSAGESSLVLS